MAKARVLTAIAVALVAQVPNPARAAEYIFTISVDRYATRGGTVTIPTMVFQQTWSTSGVTSTVYVNSDGSKDGRTRGTDVSRSASPLDAVSQSLTGYSAADAQAYVAVDQDGPGPASTTSISIGAFLDRTTYPTAETRREAQISERISLSLESNLADIGILSERDVADMLMSTGQLSYRYQMLDYTSDIGGGPATGPVRLYQGTATLTGFVPTAVQTAVPEPVTWATMLVGFGMVGGAMRRRRAVPVAA